MDQAIGKSWRRTVSVHVSMALLQQPSETHLVGTTIRCGPHTPSSHARYASNEIAWMSGEGIQAREHKRQCNAIHRTRSWNHVPIQGQHSMP
jgi:hypothetical protein